MPDRAPVTRLHTHEVLNQPPAFENRNAFVDDRPLQEALYRGSAEWAVAALTEFGASVGSAEVQEQGEQANTHPPVLRAFDRHGRRVDEVRYHPAYHQLMALGIAYGTHSLGWSEHRPGSKVAQAALLYLLHQAEPGVCCPLVMTSAAVPALQASPELASEWTARLLSRHYDGRSLPVMEKNGATVGMAMTEKQGGSDLRTNTTRAEHIGGDQYLLTGHKWFCSAPMSDAFLTLARVDDRLTCFLVPRWCPDGSRNPIRLQRLKDKLGNRANASSEIEFQGAWAQRLGDEGRGVATIIEMAHHTRLHTSVAPASLMRQSLALAIHHASHRHAFGRPLLEQPLMRAVLVDLALESEAATMLAFRLAAAFDAAARDTAESRLARLLVPVVKYWINKRTPVHVAECMECLGGGGYVEDSLLPRIYREAPLNGIWEGSGNIMCLDFLRALARDHEGHGLLMDQVVAARGFHPLLERALERLSGALAAPNEETARSLVGDVAVTLAASLLAQHAPEPVALGYVHTRLGTTPARCFGELPAGLEQAGILERARPAGR